VDCLEIGLFLCGFRHSGDKVLVTTGHLQCLGVEDELLDGSTLDGAGPRTANLVEIVKGQLSVEERVIAPGQQHLVRVFPFGVCLHHSLAVLLGSGAARTVPDGRTQSSMAMISDIIVKAVSSGWSCCAIKLGTRTLSANVSSTVSGWSQTPGISDGAHRSPGDPGVDGP